MRRRTRPEVFHGLVAGGLSLGVGLALLLIFRLPWTAYHLLAAWLVGVNLTTFGYYGYDKARARSLGRRVPEVVLHGLALLGGSVGAYLGMAVFRHKTVKAPFRFFFWFVVVLQALLIAAVLYRAWKG